MAAHGVRRPTVVILTALPLEYTAVRAHLTDVETLVHPSGTRVEHGRLPGTPWCVALAEIGEGTLTAATVTERVHTWLSPQALFFVGVAGGLKDDIRIGDVVVATKVYGVHGGKQTPEGFLVRPEAWRSSHRLEQAARHALRGKAHFKPIAVGDIILADAASAIGRHLHQHYNDAVAIEMEGAGVAHAAHLTGQLDALIIRGISDKADASKPMADAEGSQPQAMRNAAEAAVAVLRELEPTGAGLPSAVAETVSTLGAADLEVHSAAAASTHLALDTPLTPYLLRDHDVRLREVLQPVVAGGPSRLVMLTGESSTGKTRALFEALSELAPDLPLLRPATATDLLDLLRGAQVRPGVVLWLNEAQRVFYGTNAESAAAQLRTVLAQTRGVVAVATLWTSPYWEELTRHGVAGDPHAHVRALLMSSSVRQFAVPGELSDRDVEKWKGLAAEEGDQRLDDALAAGLADGRIIQHLSGGPELLQAYLDGPGQHFTHVEHALVTAAVDARRLGHRSPLTAALLAEAADGMLTPRRRPAEPDWARQVLTALATGERPGGQRTDIRHALTALTAVRARSGAEPLYEPADYLEQHLQGQRADELPAPSLWQALLSRTTNPDDLNNIADAARSRRLYQHAIRLGHKAAQAGDPQAAIDVFTALNPAVDPHQHGSAWVAAHADTASAFSVTTLLADMAATDQRGPLAELARRIASHIDFTHAYDVVRVLEALAKTGQQEAIALLMARDPATHTDVRDLHEATTLLKALAAAGQNEAFTVLAGRAAAHVDLAGTNLAADLLAMLDRSGQHEAMAILANRIALHADVSGELGQYGLGELLAELVRAGQLEALAVLADRIAARCDFTVPSKLAEVLSVLAHAGQMTQSGVLADRVAAHCDLRLAPELLRVLAEFGQQGPVGVLAGRIAAEAPLADSDDGRELLHEALTALHEAGQPQGAAVLALRAAEDIDVTHASGVAHTLGALARAEEHEAIAVLMARAPAAHADLTELSAVTHLLEALAAAGQKKAARKLARRAAAKGNLGAGGAARLLRVMRELEQHGVARELAARIAAHYDVADPLHVADLVSQGMGLFGYGDEEMISAVVARAAAETSIADAMGVSQLLSSLMLLPPWTHGTAEAVRVLATRIAAHADITYPGDFTEFLMPLWMASGHERGAVAPLAEWAARHGRVTEPGAVAFLLDMLEFVEQHSMIPALADRAAQHVQLTDAAGVAWLLSTLKRTGQDRAERILLSRDPAAHFEPSYDEPAAQQLRDAGHAHLAELWTQRCLDAGRGPIFGPNSPYGRDLDGHPLAAWTWDDLNL